METILLQTKLYIPPFRPDLVSRPQLVERLTDPQPRKLILLSAPAGYGKTTLAAEWITQIQGQTPVCWLSLDVDDNDAAQFFSYLAATIQPLQNVGYSLSQSLLVPQLPSAKNLMSAFINDVSAVPASFYLVLDDFHVIENAEIDQAMAFLLEHIPPHVTLAITSRTDPGFPISRLRANGELLELRADDLRFQQAEAAEFLHRHIGIQLTLDQIAALESRTEGWVAGLQMAALSMRGRDDVAGFIDGFTGSHRFVMDFLLEEVLDQQSADIQRFLRETAVLDRFCADLCDAVRGSEVASLSSQHILQQLEMANLFLIPLDDERRWYRYHHLFADLLRQKLQQRPSNVESLHKRASQWYEEHRLELEAFHHATAANDFERAFRLAAGNGVPLHLRGGGGAVLKWLDALPESALNAEPELWLMYTSALAFVGQGGAAEKKLAAAEAILNQAEPNEHTRDLIGRVAALRAMFAISYNQIDIMVEQSLKALDHLHPDNVADRTSATLSLGYAYQIQGDLARARQAYADVIATSSASGNEMFLIGATISLGQIQLLSNEVNEAYETFQKVIDMSGDPPLPPACEAHLGLARVYYEWMQLELAESHARMGYELGIHVEAVDTPAFCQMILARITLAQNRVDEAAQYIEAAERFIDQNGFEHCRSSLDEIKELFRQHADAAKAKRQLLVDPLSERELEILSHIAAGLKNKEIAAELFVSINTVHYHTKNIYGKLGANNRTQAIAKARELNLL